MTKEQAIGNIKKVITTKFNNDYSIDNVDKEAIETVLFMLEEKDKEIEKLKKQIPSMTNGTFTGDFKGLLKIDQEIIKRDKIIEHLINDLYDLAIAIDEEYAVEEYLLNKKTIKEYYYKKVKETKDNGSTKKL